MKRGSVAELRPCLGQGASWRAGVWRVRRLAFLSILQGGVLPLCTHADHRISRVQTSFSLNLLRFSLHQGPPLIADGKHEDSQHDHGEGEELAHGERSEDKTKLGIRFANEFYDYPT